MEKKNIKRKDFLLVIVTLLLIFGSIFIGKNRVASAGPLDYRIIKTYPHNSASFTQGLVWHDNYLYEGTGLYGESKLVKVDLDTGKSLQEYLLGKHDFGEGITIFDGKLYQLTWQENKIYVYNHQNFKKIDEYYWPLEGWGLAHDNTHLIISTGSNRLYFLDPDDLTIIKSIDVLDGNRPISLLNELEYANGFIYANQFLSTNIWKINPKTGQAAGVLNLENIFNMAREDFVTEDSQENVLNGIAYNPVKNTFYVTGKRWHHLFEIEIF